MNILANVLDALEGNSEKLTRLRLLDLQAKARIPSIESAHVHQRLNLNSPPWPTSTATTTPLAAAVPTWCQRRRRFAIVAPGESAREQRNEGQAGRDSGFWSSGDHLQV